MIPLVLSLSRTQRILALCMSLLVLSAIGCGSSGPEMVPIRGTVKFDGKPLSGGTVEYIPTDPQGRKALGRIGADGDYVLTTFKAGDGAIVGSYKVVVVSLAPHPGEPTPEQLLANGGKPIRRKSLIPDHYSDMNASGLSDKVDSDHSGTFDIDLEISSEGR